MHLIINYIWNLFVGTSLWKSLETQPTTTDKCQQNQKHMHRARFKDFFYFTQHATRDKYYCIQLFVTHNVHSLFSFDSIDFLSTWWHFSGADGCSAIEVNRWWKTAARNYRIKNRYKLSNRVQLMSILFTAFRIAVNFDRHFRCHSIGAIRRDRSTATSDRFRHRNHRWSRRRWLFIVALGVDQ
jgi:hypothetical protein